MDTSLDTSRTSALPMTRWTTNTHADSLNHFDRCCDMFLPAFPERKILRHILNSTGIVRFPEHQFDMVRLGIGLYGVRTMHDGSQDALRPVSSLRSVIISVKSWPAGTTIGYNRRGVLKPGLGHSHNPHRICRRPQPSSRLRQCLVHGRGTPLPHRRKHLHGRPA